MIALYSIATNAVGEEVDICSDTRFSQKTGYSFIIKPDISLYQGSEPFAQATDNKLPALTKVHCFDGQPSNDGYRVLISAEINTQKLCGWVDSTALLPQPHSSASKPCPPLQEVKIKDYIPNDSSKENSPLNLKLMTWNINTNPDTTTATDQNSKSHPQVPAFAYPDGPQVGEISIYSVFPVYAFKRDTTSDIKDWFLIASDPQHLLGWVKGKDGVIWDNRLTFYFKAGFPNAYIYYTQDKLAAAYRNKHSAYLAIRPDNLDYILNKAERTFPKFPILEDLTSGYNPPQYKIAFIGEWCSGDNCAVEQQSKIADALRAMQNMDILFLIDATESMEPYFSAVAGAVTETVYAQYSDKINIRLGVSMYSDFFQKDCKSSDCPIQYKQAIPLQSLAQDNDFSNLPNQTSFKDPQEDKPEAVFEALLRAANQTLWVKNGWHLLIHIGDHGPRNQDALSSVTKQFKQQNILYVPIAVTGNYNREFNASFREATQALVNTHKTATGAPMGVFLTTYDPETTNGSLDSGETKQELKRQLSVALNLPEKIDDTVRQELFTVPTQTVQPTNGNELVGVAKLMPALREIFGVDTDRIERIRQQGTLVTPGYIGKYDKESGQDQWEYFVAIEPSYAITLSSIMEVLCVVAKDSKAIPTLKLSMQTLAQAMSGDNIPDNQSLYEYLSNILKIPLAENTILRKSIEDLQTEIENLPPAGLKEFKKNMCKAAIQFDFVKSSLRLTPGQELTWDDTQEQWNFGQTEPYRWDYTPSSGSAFIYLPLEFFPK